MSPIFIASKGRPDCPTAKLLQADGVPFFVLVVEPQDYEEYARLNPTMQIMVLPANDMGVTYARNHIKNVLAPVLNQPWFWMMDDDIKKFYLVENGKVVPYPASVVLSRAEEVLMAIPNIAVGAMEYQQYAWSAKKPSVKNSYCDVAVLVNLERTQTLSYRDNCKEDRDFVLQCLAVGYESARSSWTAFSVPKNGSNKGGLHDAYAKGLENHWSERMTQLWPSICERVTKKDGRPDVKIHWKKLRAK